MFTLVIPEASPSANSYAYAHWSARYKDKKRWRGLIWMAIRRTKTTDADGRRRLTIVRCGKREADIDNIIGGAKGIIDLLVEAKLLLGDEPAHLEVSARNGKLQPGEEPRTELVLEDL